MFCLLHFLVSNVEHLFDSISAKFIFEKWGIDWTDAVWVSGINYALPIVLSPVIGHMLDRVPNRMLIASFACATMAAGHVILGFFPWTPVVGMLVLAVALSVLPTILRSSVPVVVPHGVSGPPSRRSSLEPFGVEQEDPCKASDASNVPTTRARAGLPHRCSKFA